MEIAVTCCEFLFPIYHFNISRFLQGSTKLFSFPSVLYRSEKTIKILTKETGNLRRNKTNENGAVEVGEGQLEAAFCPIDDRREINEDLETTKNLNEDNPLEGDTKLDEENTSEGDEPMDGDSTSKEDDALNGWKELRMEVRVIKNNTFSKKRKNLFAVISNSGNNLAGKKGNILSRKIFFIFKSYRTIS